MDLTKYTVRLLCPLRRFYFDKILRPLFSIYYGADDLKYNLGVNLIYIGRHIAGEYLGNAATREASHRDGWHPMYWSTIDVKQVADWLPEDEALDMLKEAEDCILNDVYEVLSYLSQDRKHESETTEQNEDTKE